MRLRPYQQEMNDRIEASWAAGKRVPVAVLGTGTGKTALFCHMVKQSPVPSIVIAHRQELVAQMSMTLGRYGVEHRVIAPQSVRRTIEAMHLKHFGRRWIRHNAPAAAAGVDTLVRMDADDPFLRSVGFWVGDEFHHFLRDNKWGRAVSKLPVTARGLGVTATPLRADNKGLGAHAHGLADDLLVGPPMRESIQSGMLCDYRIFAPPSTLDLSAVNVTAGGDFSPKPLHDAVHKSSITGDVVRSYLRIAPGKRGITFAVDIQHAEEITAAYKAACVPAALLTGTTDPRLRSQVMRQFEAGQILQLVNVDILGEGVDVPACEVVSFARPTASLGLYVQQFGRALRLMIAPELMGRWGDLTSAERLAHIAASVKPVAIVIDHVGNVARHLLPDMPRPWTLDARITRGGGGPRNPDEIPLRTCLNDLCFFTYPRMEPACPVCGHIPVPAGRSRPEEVDGDLHELDPAVLARMRGEADRILGPVQVPYGMSGLAAAGLAKQHGLRRDAQIRLGDAIAWWAGWQAAQGRGESESYKRFFFQFGVDVATARTLGRPDAEALAAQIEQVLQCNGINKESNT